MEIAQRQVQDTCRQLMHSDAAVTLVIVGQRGVSASEITLRQFLRQSR